MLYTHLIYCPLMKAERPLHLVPNIIHTLGGNEMEINVVYLFNVHSVS